MRARRVKVSIEWDPADVEDPADRMLEYELLDCEADFEITYGYERVWSENRLVGLRPDGNDTVKLQARR